MTAKLQTKMLKNTNIFSLNFLTVIEYIINILSELLTGSYCLIRFLDFISISESGSEVLIKNRVGSVFNIINNILISLARHRAREQSG